MESASINMGTKQSQPKQAESNDKVSYRVLVQPNSEHSYTLFSTNSINMGTKQSQPK